MAASMHRPHGAGDSPGAADSAKDRYTEKSYLIFSWLVLQIIPLIFHRGLLTMGTHLLPDDALSVLDTQVWTYHVACWCLYYFSKKKKILHKLKVFQSKRKKK